MHGRGPPIHVTNQPINLVSFLSRPPTHEHKIGGKGCQCPDTQVRIHPSTNGSKTLRHKPSKLQRQGPIAIAIVTQLE